MQINWKYEKTEGKKEIINQNKPDNLVSLKSGTNLGEENAAQFVLQSLYI